MRSYINLAKLLLLLFTLYLSACAAEEFDGRVMINVISGKAIPTTSIQQYKIIVIGEGIDTPIETLIPSDAKEAMIRDVPCGSNRTIEVVAIDNYGRSVRKGEELVEINGGVNEVDIALKAIPIFSNILENGIVEGNRLQLKVSSDPGDKIVLSQIVGEEHSDFINPNSNDPTFSISEGENDILFAPKDVALGWRTFSAKSLITGYGSEIRIRLVAPGTLRPAPLLASGKPGCRVGNLVKQ